MDYYKIGQKIKKYRKVQGLTQEQLAEQIGISSVHMSHIETGSTKLSLPVFIAAANALGVQADDLLSDEDFVRQPASQEISDLLVGCTEKQLQILTDVLRTMKTALGRYDEL
ncbi:helix-turn-helix domain-containing protein [Harryflintia acetispora]|uniref:helix-turn-helix domain-containing protein n=1 Tax=Harryflintia acetispora TaxID=1849041 RepID=UPI00189C2D9D|nr:helix-turn-helix transcriptional regulator [Harryflintia acetispora]